MKIAVIGLWHLGSVTAACLAKLGFDVIAFDEDEHLIKNYLNNILPIYEPGLQELVSVARKNRTLNFTNDISCVAEADLVWITYDTPVDDNDQADTSFVEERVINLFPFLRSGVVLLVSSQMPVGSIESLRKIYELSYGIDKVDFACSPENLRLGNAISVFTNPDRIVVGVSSEMAKQKLSTVLTKISENILWMSVQSAEMTKHAINAFLATSVVFINELAVLCELVGADASEVEKGLKTEQRIGPKSYLKPGSAFAGGTLARDLSYLVDRNNQFGIPALFFESIINSNSYHRDWAKNTIKRVCKDLTKKNVFVLGLTYKAGTDTLRRSQSIELCKWLVSEKARVVAFDPQVTLLPIELKDIKCLNANVESELANAAIIVISTEWPQFAEIDFDKIDFKVNPIIVDANGFLKQKLENKSNINYYRIGKSNEIKK